MIYIAKYLYVLITLDEFEISFVFILTLPILLLNFLLQLSEQISIVMVSNLKM